MSIDYNATLGTTIRVAADGTITRGIKVPPMSTPTLLAAAPRHSAPGMRFAPGGIPRGVNQHLPCTEHNCSTCFSIDQNYEVVL